MSCGCSPFTPPPGAALFPLSNTFFFDAATATPPAQQNGMITSPFATLAQGLALGLPSMTFVLTDDFYGSLSLDDTSPVLTLIGWSSAVIQNVTLTLGASLTLMNMSVSGALNVTEASVVLVNCLPASGITLTDPIEASFDLLTLARRRTAGGGLPFGLGLQVRDAPTVRQFLTLPVLTAPESAEITFPFDGARPGDTFTATGIDDVNPWPAAAILGMPKCTTDDEVLIPIFTLTVNVAADECGILVTQFPVARGG